MIWWCKAHEAMQFGVAHDVLLEAQPQLDQLARDLAAVSSWDLDAARRALHSALISEAEALAYLRKPPWWWRIPFLPMRWRQSWIWNACVDSPKETNQ